MVTIVLRRIKCPPWSRRLKTALLSRIAPASGLRACRLRQSVPDDPQIWPSRHRPRPVSSSRFCTRNLLVCEEVLQLAASSHPQRHEALAGSVTAQAPAHRALPPPRDIPVVASVGSEILRRHRPARAFTVTARARQRRLARNVERRLLVGQRHTLLRHLDHQSLILTPHTATLPAAPPPSRFASGLKQFRDPFHVLLRQLQQVPPRTSLQRHPQQPVQSAPDAHPSAHRRQVQPHSTRSQELPVPVSPAAAAQSTRAPPRPPRRPASAPARPPGKCSSTAGMMRRRSTFRRA
jgi:hypothetical protein